MELRHLRYFVDIARLENMSKVAEKNHVAQSALSRVVAVLEVDTNMAWSASIPFRPSVEIFRDFALNYYREMGGVKAPETP